MCDVSCPLCGTINKKLILEETDGWFECIKCGELINTARNVSSVSVPIFELSSILNLVSQD